jgi:hypothetical protein
MCKQLTELKKHNLWLSDTYSQVLQPSISDLDTAMMEQIYYIKWRTWSEKEIQTPWDFWILKEGTDYHPRTHSVSTMNVTQQTLEQAWISQNSQLLEHIQNNFIADIHLMTFVIAPNQQQAIDQIQGLFDDAQILQTTPVTPHQQQEILKLIERTVRRDLRV